VLVIELIGLIAVMVFSPSGPVVGPLPGSSARPAAGFGFDRAFIATHSAGTAAPQGPPPYAAGHNLRHLNEILLFLDVDGTLLPFAPRGRTARPRGNPLLDRLDPADGARLRSLGCSLVWATTWMHEANEVLSPRLGLPSLPLVDWSDDEEQPPLEVHWKTPSLVRWAAGRPFAWLDDEIFDADRRWIAAHHPARALAHRVDPRSGLIAADFAAVQRWLAAI
jgi:hypothetical protein